jgi:hypothetical protein
VTEVIRVTFRVVAARPGLPGRHRAGAKLSHVTGFLRLALVCLARFPSESPRSSQTPLAASWGSPLPGSWRGAEAGGLYKKFFPAQVWVHAGPGTEPDLRHPRPEPWRDAGRGPSAGPPGAEVDLTVPRKPPNVSSCPRGTGRRKAEHPKDQRIFKTSSHEPGNGEG